MDNKETWPHEQPLHDVPMDRQIVELNRTVAKLTAQLVIATKKADSSLANNLCPDHRDKQKGKPCLACEIERLIAQLEERDLAIKGLQEDIALIQANQDRFMEVETARLQHSVKCRELTAQLEEARRDLLMLDSLDQGQWKAERFNNSVWFQITTDKWDSKTYQTIREAIDAVLQPERKKED